MGTLIYGAGEHYEFEDRMLAHVKMAAVAKLRRRESFLMNWAIPAERGSGRISLWISPASHLQFWFSEARPPELNKAWLEALAFTAYRTGGMEIMDEADADEFLRQQGRLKASGQRSATSE